MQGAPLTTYARKRGRSRLLHASSSPVKAIDHEGLSLVEMTQRMKKRARQSTNGPRLGHEKGLSGSQNFQKRSKNIHTAVPTPPDSDSISVFPLDPLTSLGDGTNNLQYQTPFNMSPVSSPTAPDSMSPVPPSRRHLSGIGSRNLKENKIVKRLASPFHSRSVSKACSRSGSKPNSPKKEVKKPPFYIKTRTRSEANADTGENVPDEVLFPVSGSLPTLRPMKTAVYGPHLDGSSTTYMLQSLSGQDWLRPAKALSRSPFPDDYVPPGTPFEEWDCSSEAFLGGVPLQTSTPNAVKDTLRRHISADVTLSAPNTSDLTHTLGDVNTNIDSFSPGDLESPRVTWRHSTHDSIFSTFLDASPTRSTSILRSNSKRMESTIQGDPVSPTVAHLPDSGQAVVRLSGMLDGLDIDGVKNSSPGLVQRTRSLDNSTQDVALPSPSSDGRQTAGRRRDRASTIRASDYLVKPVTSVPGSGVTSTSVAALTTRTRSGTIRPVRPPVASLSSGFPPATSQPCVGQRQALSGPSYNPLAFADSDGNSSPGSTQSEQKSHFSGVKTTESMVIDMSNDESDDELLLDRKGWNWDGRWD